MIKYTNKTRIFNKKKTRAISIKGYNSCLYLTSTEIIFYLFSSGTSTPKTSYKVSIAIGIINPRYIYPEFVFSDKRKRINSF